MIERETVVRGTRIHWLEEGSGDPPFLLIHGWGSSTAKWLDVLPLLGAERRTIALDLPGFGSSDAPAGPYTAAWLAGAVRAFCDEIGVERAIWAGNSLGGLVAIHAAAAWPDRVDALIAVDPALPNEGSGRPDPKTLASFLLPALPLLGELAYQRYIRRSPEDLVRESLERNCARPERISETTRLAMLEDARLRVGRRDHARAVVRTNRAMMWALSARREATWRILGSVAVPTLFVWGSHDRLVPASVGERALEKLPGSELIVIDDCGHNPQMECPEEFSASAIAFARKTSASSPGC
ncbi:MAG: alpha/beta fold hydrolase [Actinomycetota bacterium]